MTKKTITLILIISYIITSSGPCYGFGAKTLFTRKSHAQRHVNASAKAAEKDILEASSSLSIPKSLGRVVESYKGKNKKLIIHIQDRHVDPVTQNNIASIIEALNLQHNIYLMCLEGAFNELDTSFYNSFEDAVLKKKVAEVFVQQGLFTGPEFYKITNAENYIRAVGAEDRALYLKHLANYKENQINKDEITRLLRHMGKATDALKKHVFSKELIALDKVSRDYVNKQIDLPEYLLQLNAYAAKSDILPEEYSNLNKFIHLTERERSIDFKAAEQERESLIRYFSERLPKEGVQALVQLSLDFRSNKVSDIVFHDYLESLAVEHGLNSAIYKNLVAYTEYLRLSREINHLKVFDEAQDLEERTQIALCNNQDQQSLVQYSKSVSMLKDLYALKLTHRHLDYMDEHPGSFDIANIQKFLNKTSAKYGLDTLLTDSLISPDRQALNNSKEFYRLALMRDIALTDNTLKRMKQYRKDKAILVTGGFHTQGITNILRKKDISYVVICPTIGLNDCDKIYEKRINGTLPSMYALQTALANMLSVQLKSGEADVQELFSKAYQSVSQPAVEAQDILIAKASSSGLGGYVVKNLIVAATVALLGTGIYIQQSSVSSQKDAMDTFVIAKALPSDQWQIILDTLREIYALIKDIEAPKPRQMEMKFKVGKAARILRDYITNNLDSIHKYAKEEGIEPNYLAAIIIAEQMDIDEFSLKGEGTDKILPRLHIRDTSRGPGQITERALKKHCKETRWPAYDNRSTEELSDSEINAILMGEGGNLTDHIRAIAIILRGKRDSIKDSAALSLVQGKLQLGALYTSTYRGLVKEDKEDFCTFRQLRESEKIRTQVYAHAVIIYEDFVSKWLRYHKYAYVPDDMLSMTLPTDNAVDSGADGIQDIQAKASSSGRKIMHVWENGHPVLPGGSQATLMAGLGVCFAVAAKHTKTEERYMAHLYPLRQTGGAAGNWKDAYINTMLSRLDSFNVQPPGHRIDKARKGNGWNAVVIPSGKELDGYPKEDRITLEDITERLEAAGVDFIADINRAHKLVRFQKDGSINIILPETPEASYDITALTKASSSGRDIDRGSFYNLIPSETRPSAKIYDYTDTEDRYEIIESLKSSNWYYQADGDGQKAAIINRAFNTLSDSAINQLKSIITERMQENGNAITEDTIESIMVYGSWIYNFDDKKISNDIDFAVIAKGDIPVQSIRGVRIPKTLFKDTADIIPVEQADIRIIGTEQLLLAPDEKEYETTHFEVSMQGHGILLWGRNFFQRQPMAHNLMVMARTFLSIMEFYLDVKLHSTHYPEEYLDTLNKRLDEVYNIFKVLFKNLDQPEQPLAVGIIPVDKAVKDMKAVMRNVRKYLDGYSYEAFQDILNTGVASGLNALYVQTETKFMKESLEALGKKTQARTSSSGAIITRPLDKIPPEEIKNILVVGDYKKIIPMPKLGETIIDLWPLVTSLCKKYPESKIFVSAPYTEFYLAGDFKGQVVPIPSTIKDIRDWGYAKSTWITDDINGEKVLRYNAKDMCALTQAGYKARKEFIQDEIIFERKQEDRTGGEAGTGIDMVFDVSVAQGLRNEFLGKQRGRQPYYFSIASFLKYASATNVSVGRYDQECPAQYRDKKGDIHDVNYGNTLDGFLNVPMLKQADIWKASIAITAGLGLDVTQDSLRYITLTESERQNAISFLSEVSGIFDGKNETAIFDTTKKIILVNVYAQTQSVLMGYTIDQQIDTWVDCISTTLKSMRNTYIVFTRGGEMDDNYTFVDQVARELIKRSKGSVAPHQNAVILPKESLYSRINEVVGLSDAVITLDTGMSHYANGVFNKPTLLITSSNILHWAAPRENVYPIIRTTIPQKNTHYTELDSIKHATMLLNALLGVKSVREILKSRKQAKALSWLDSNDRMQQLRTLMQRKYDPAAEIVMDDVVDQIFPKVVADFIEKKAGRNAEYLWPLSVSPKASSAGTKILDEELYYDVSEAIEKSIEPLYEKASSLGLGRLTFITTVRELTEIDKKHLRNLAR